MINKLNPLNKLDPFSLNYWKDLDETPLNKLPLPAIDEAYFNKLIGKGNECNWELGFDFDYDTNNFIASIDLPGCKKDNIIMELDFASKKIIINSFRTLHKSTVKVNKSLMIPRDCDTGKLKASLADGVLTITIPKTPPQTAKFTKITID